MSNSAANGSEGALERSWPTPDASHVQEAVRRLVNAFDPLHIVVFGSYARGDTQPGSDLDLLVVLPHVDHKRNTAVAMRRELSDFPISKDIIIAPPAEIEERRNSTWHIIARALENGITVYSKQKNQA